MKKYARSLILFLISLIEKHEYRNNTIGFDQDDDSKKIIDTIDVSDKGYKVLTDTGYQPLTHIHKTQPYKVHRIATQDFILEGADRHIVFDEHFNEVFIKDLSVGDYIQTKNGLQQITEMGIYNSSVSMYDITVDSPDHRFYADGILSHNSVMTAIFINWYVIFNTEKNILVMANKGETMKEIIDKIVVIHGGLPYFMKPGIFKKNMSEIRFDNDCKIFGQATTKTAAIGFSVDFLFADEFAKIPDNIASEFYASIYPTLSSMTNSRMVITSTADGLNLFYRIFSGAEKGLNRFKSMITYWYEVPGRDEKWKQETIADLGGDEERFNREFGCQFLNPSNLLLDSQTLLELQESTKPYKHMDIEIFDDMEVDYNGLLWDDVAFDSILDNNKNRFYVLGVDLSEGIGRDYSVINIFELCAMNSEQFSNLKNINSEKDFVYFKQIGIYRKNDSSIEEVVKIAIGLLEFLGPENTKINLEYNMNGGYFFNMVKSNYDEYFDEIFIRTKHTVDAKKRSVGVKVTGGNKTNMCVFLKKNIRQKQVVFNEENTVNEMLSFGLDKHGHYNSQTGHDDIAMTLVGLSACYGSYEFEDMVMEVLENMKLEDNKKMYELIEKHFGGEDSLDFYGGTKGIEPEGTMVVSKRLY